MSDGRVLSYRDYGAPLGLPFIFLHGIPSSRLAAGLLDDAARRQGIRLISVDRPGYGYSSNDRGRSILDWAADVADLADQLELPEFGVIGISGALPFALACAIRMPQRLSHVAILSGLGPLSVPGIMNGMHRESATLYRLALRSPRLGRIWMTMLAQTAKRSPGVVYRRQLSYLPAVDRAVFTHPEMRDLRISDLAEAFRQGADGAAHEAALYVSDWGFELHDVPVEVFLWQGALDQHHPAAMGRYVASQIPMSRLVVVEDAGAFGFVGRMDEIFAQIVRPEVTPLTS